MAVELGDEGFFQIYEVHNYLFTFPHNAPEGSRFLHLFHPLDVPACAERLAGAGQHYHFGFFIPILEQVAALDTENFYLFASFVEAIGLADEIPAAAMGAVFAIAEALGLNDATSTYQHVGLAEALRTLDVENLFEHVSLGEGVGISDAADIGALAIFMAIAEAIVLQSPGGPFAPTLQPMEVFNMASSFAEALGISETAAFFLFASLSEAISAQTTENLGMYQSYAEAVGISDESFQPILDRLAVAEAVAAVVLAFSELVRVGMKSSPRALGGGAGAIASWSGAAGAARAQSSQAGAEAAASWSGTAGAARSHSSQAGAEAAWGGPV